MRAHVSQHTPPACSLSPAIVMSSAFVLVRTHCGLLACLCPEIETAEIETTKIMTTEIDTPEMETKEIKTTEIETTEIETRQPDSS